LGGLGMTERATGPSTSAYDRLIELLDSGNARYRLIDHEPDGRTGPLIGP
jgi:Ala-tRNA(Pro) deacylase